MFGIREVNYRWDDKDHNDTRPSYQQFLEFNDWDDLPSNHRANLRSRSEYDPIYHKSLLHKLKYRFSNVERLTQNFSQSWQDFFVLTMLDGLRQGFYLELGACDPVYCNNTYLLETMFDWQGVSIDKRDEIQNKWQEHRPNSKFLLADCLESDLLQILIDNQAPSIIDYLQVDLAQDSTFRALTKLPHDRHRFRVITFETDVFTGYRADQDRAREFLQALGYQLLIDNVAVKNYPTHTWEPFEDWYVDPNLIDQRLIDMFKCIDGQTKLPHEIFVTE